MSRMVAVRLLVLMLSVWVGAPTAQAEDRPRIAIIIDDLGDNLVHGLRATQLEGSVTCAFLPFSPYTKILARHAHFKGKEVMLHLPMDALDDRPLGGGGLKVNMTHARFLSVLRADLMAVPYMSGVNNHMGSLLTQLPENMAWLMSELSRRPLYFIDSRTTRATVAREQAVSWGVPSQDRDLFLDNLRTRAGVNRQFKKLLDMARKRGYALAIGHPYVVTLDLLESRLPGLLAEEGIDLVPVSGLLGGDYHAFSDMALAKRGADARSLSVPASQ